MVLSFLSQSSAKTFNDQNVTLFMPSVIVSHLKSYDGLFTG